MKVRELMTSNPSCCQPGDTLSSAAAKMWEGDCGVLPVIKQGRSVGILTDRDICMATTMQGLSPEAIKVADAMSKEMFECKPTDDVSKALQAMKTHRIRRMPVVDKERTLVGILSLNDVVLASRATSGKAGAPTFKEVVQTMQGICEHRDIPAVA